MSEMSLSSFADEITRIMPVIHRELLKRQVDEVLKGTITFQQLLILEYLEREKSMKMSDLARLMNVTTAAATGIIERLVKEGFVQRCYDDKDRRLILIRPTPKGVRIVSRVGLQRRELIVKIFNRINQRDRSEYLRILKEIGNVLTEGLN